MVKTASVRQASDKGLFSYLLGVDEESDPSNTTATDSSNTNVNNDHPPPPPTKQDAEAEEDVKVVGSSHTIYLPLDFNVKRNRLKLEAVAKRCGLSLGLRDEIELILTADTKEDLEAGRHGIDAVINPPKATKRSTLRRIDKADRP
ncbi:hypothetical protein HKX48_002748, partial [Thoreauomyces humboldtii]